jgi:hypothetical protein
MTTKTILAAGFILLASPWLASPCLAAIQLQPGEWQTTETGTEDGQPVPPQVEKDCLTAEESRDATNLVKQMRDQMQGQGAQCQTFDVKQSGDSVTFTMKCGVPKQFLVDMTGTFNFVSPTRYTGTMKSAVTMMGKTTTSDKKTEAVRLGECKGK